MGYTRRVSTSEHTTGELAALVGPVVNVGAEDVSDAIVIIITTQGHLKMAGTMCADCIGDVLINAVAINEMTQATERPQ